MVNKTTRDRFGASCRARSPHTVFGTLAEFGGGDLSMRQRVTLRVPPNGWLTITAAPQTYLGIVRTSAALHERSP